MLLEFEVALKIVMNGGVLLGFEPTSCKLQVNELPAAR